jgi:hypothetical protein
MSQGCTTAAEETRCTVKAKLQRCEGGGDEEGAESGRERGTSKYCRAAAVARVPVAPRERAAVATERKCSRRVRGAARSRPGHQREE